MSVTVLDAATRDAVALATTQPEQLDAIEAAFAGDITVRAMAGAVVAEVCTYGPWVRDSAEPRGMTLGALAASTVNVPDATITSFVFVEGSTPIFSIPAADASLDSPTTKTGRRTSLADAVLTKHRIIADATLPLGTALTYLLTFAAADTATVGVDFSLTITNGGTGSCSWTLAEPAHIDLSATSGTTAPGATTTLTGQADQAGTYGLTLLCPGATITGATQTVVVSLASAPGTFPTVPTTGLATLTLTPTATGTHAWSLGHTFKQGELPAGSALSGVQCTVKSTWPDGSAKIAVLAGGCAMTAATARTVGLQIGAAPGGAALTTATLAGYLTSPVTVDAGAFGSASWSGADWAAPFQTWVSGPLMSSWVYRKPIGSDAHLVAWLEVRLWTNGEVEILPWIENGYIRVAGPTSKAATYTFTMGGASRFSAAIDLPARTRTPLVSGALLSHWLGSDKGVVVRHDAAYMQATRLVPKYSATVSPSATVVTGLPSTYTPLQLGNYSVAMGGTGYQPAIGLLPEWDVLYLTTIAPAAYGGLVRNAYSAGRWGIYYRDENTNRPLRFSQFPNLSVTASAINDYPLAATGTAAGGWDVPHHPSMGYMAYLVTGRWFHLETVQFTASMNFLVQVDNQRGFEDGVFLSSSGSATTRGAAWANRTLVQAATVTPDADTALRADFIASLEANIDWNHARYVAQSNNPFGVVQTYGDAYGSGSDGKVTEAPWMQDFYTAAFGYMLAANPPVAGGIKTKLQAFFAWKAQSAVGRLGGAGSTEWLYRDAAPYNFVVALVDEPDWTTGTGPWPSSWGAMYDASYPVSPGPREDGDLRGTSGSAPSATGYWANLLPAISYAVEHEVSGASAAYLRMVGASNWHLVTDEFDANPVWSVRPPVEPGLPSWVSTLTEGTFANLGAVGATLYNARPPGWPTSDSGGPEGNWNGAVWAPDFGANGGYIKYGSGHLPVGNPLWAGVWVWDAALADWVGRCVPPQPLLEGPDYDINNESTVPETLGHPYTPHTYDGLIYQSQANGGGSEGSLIANFHAGGNGNTRGVRRFDLSSASSAPTRVIDAVPMGGTSNNYPMAALDEARGGYWLLTYTGEGPLKFVSFTDWSITTFAGSEYGDYGDQHLIYLPPPYDALFAFGRTDSGAINLSYRVSQITAGVPGAFTAITPTGTPPSSEGIGKAGGTWSTLLSTIVVYGGFGSYTVFKLTPPAPGSLLAGTWTWSSETLTGAGGAIPAARGYDYGGEYSRMVEVPAFRCFLRSDGINNRIQAWRLTGM